MLGFSGVGVHACLFAHVCVSCVRFYTGDIRHGIHIPRQDKTEMLDFLDSGPGDTPPEWINWRAVTATDGDDSSTSSSDDSSTSHDVSSDEDTDSDTPFLHLPRNPDGRKCRCGSDTHLTIQSHACPLNPRNKKDGDGESDGDSDGNNDDSSDDNTNDSSDGDNNDSSDGDNNDSSDGDNNDGSDGDSSDGDGTNSDDDDTHVPLPRKRRAAASPATLNAQRRRVPSQERVWAVGDECEVLHGVVWYPATIKFLHQSKKGGFKVLYTGDNTFECEVPSRRIRSLP